MAAAAETAGALLPLLAGFILLQLQPTTGCQLYPALPWTALLAGAGRARAQIVARKPMTIAGLGMMRPIFAAYDQACVGRPLVAEGAEVAAGTAVAEVEGPAVALLSAERILLNFLQRLSGVATRTREHVRALGASPTHLLDTRKTTPGFRMLEKYAVGQGGGHNHRLGLFDRIMIKDNHVAADGATADERLRALVGRARAARPDLLVEVEVDRPDQVEPVLVAGADVILLDNFTLPQLRATVPLIRGRAWVEVSGGVDLATLPAIGTVAPDFVSCGGLTHAAPWVDLGLDWR